MESNKNIVRKVVKRLENSGINSSENSFRIIYQPQSQSRQQSPGVSKSSKKLVQSLKFAQSSVNSPQQQSPVIMRPNTKHAGSQNLDTSQKQEVQNVQVVYQKALPQLKKIKNLQLRQQSRQQSQRQAQSQLLDSSRRSQSPNQSQINLSSKQQYQINFNNSQIINNLNNQQEDKPEENSFDKLKKIYQNRQLQQQKYIQQIILSRQNKNKEEVNQQTIKNFQNQQSNTNHSKQSTKQEAIQRPTILSQSINSKSHTNLFQNSQQIQHTARLNTAYQKIRTKSPIPSNQNMNSSARAIFIPQTSSSSREVQKNQNKKRVNINESEEVVSNDQKINEQNSFSNKIKQYKQSKKANSNINTRNSQDNYVVNNVSSKSKTRPPSPDYLQECSQKETTNSQSQQNEEQMQMIEYITEFFRKKKQYPPTIPEFYKFEKFIGKGASSKVVLATHKLTGLKVAIKTINKKRIMDEHSKRKVFQEVFILKKIRHPFVIKLFEVFESRKHLMIVMENAEGGDLLNFVRSRKRLTEYEAKDIMKQLIQSLTKINENGVLHRDIKLDNILIDGTNTSVKICDFGVSKIVKKNQIIYDHCGTPAYIAPEIVAEKGYTGFAVDVWSLGVVLYAMIIGAVPFRAKNLAELQSLILSGQYTTVDWISNEAQNLIERMLQVDPLERITLKDILKHPWMYSSFQEKSVSYEKLFKASQFKQEPKWGTINEEILDETEKLGFNRSYIIDCLKGEEINHCTTTYHLLLYNKHKQSIADWYTE